MHPRKFISIALRVMVGGAAGTVLMSLAGAFSSKAPLIIAAAIFLVASGLLVRSVVGEQTQR